MARLGELLIAAGLLTPEQIERALRAQVLWGARIGTNLIELGFLDLDTLSSALGRQHRLPAALARHFDKVDPELQARLSPAVAHAHACLPLMRVGPRHEVVIASASPLSTHALATIAADLGVDPALLIPAIAAELRIQYQLERVYRLARSSRFMRSPGKTVPPFPLFEIEAVPPDSEPDLLLEPVPGTRAASPAAPEAAAPVAIGGDVDVTLPFQTRPRGALIAATGAATGAAPVVLRAPTLDDLAVDPEAPAAGVPVPVAEDDSAGRERRKYVRTIADAPSDSERQLGRIAIRRLAVPVEAAPSGEAPALAPSTTPMLADSEPPRAVRTLGEATRAIRRALDRDTVADLSIDTLFRFAPSCDAVSLLVVRGQVATSWKGFNRSGAPAPELAVPLDQRGMVPSAVAHDTTMSAPATELCPIDQLLLVSLGQQTGKLVVVPISIAGQVMCLIAMVTATDTATATAESVAAAAGAAFARLIRDAAR